MKTTLIRCDNPQGGLSYFNANYDGLQLSNFVFASSRVALNQAPVTVSFCPDTQYINGEFTGNSIENLQVFNKRSEAQRQANMVFIASLLNSKFNR